LPPLIRHAEIILPWTQIIPGSHDICFLLHYFTLPRLDCAVAEDKQCGCTIS
jgi:hypothetical protein